MEWQCQQSQSRVLWAFSGTYNDKVEWVALAGLIHDFYFKGIVRGQCKPVENFFNLRCNFSLWSKPHCELFECFNTYLLVNALGYQSIVT